MTRADRRDAHSGGKDFWLRLPQTAASQHGGGRAFRVAATTSAITRADLVAPHAWSELDLPDGKDQVEARLDVRGLCQVTCRVRSKEMIYDGLLNADFSERHVLTVDLRTGRASAKAR
jgi:hypothetical protein